MTDQLNRLSDLRNSIRDLGYPVALDAISHAIDTCNRGNQVATEIWLAIVLKNMEEGK